MHIEVLRYFVRLAQAGSFAAAARTLFISQQGLNKAIGTLETELECTLVKRSRTGVRLTKDGRILLAHAQHILDEHERLVGDLIEQRQSTASDLRPPIVHATYYAAQIAAGLTEHRSLLESVSYLEEPFPKILERAESDTESGIYLVDIYPRTRTLLNSRNDVVFEPIVATDFGVVWKEGSPLAEERTIHRDSLSEIPLAYNTFREMANLTDWIFAEHPLRNVRMGATNPRALLEFAQSSSQVACTFDSFGFHLAKFDPDMPTNHLHFTPLSTPKAHCHLGLLHSRDRKRPLQAQHAANLIKRALTEGHDEYFARHPL